MKNLWTEIDSLLAVNKIQRKSASSALSKLLSLSLFLIFCTLCSWSFFTLSKGKNPKSKQLKCTYLSAQTGGTGDPCPVRELCHHRNHQNLVGKLTWLGDHNKWLQNLLERRGRRVTLYVKDKFECMEARWDHKRSCLWIKIRGVITKGDLTFGICYWPPNQEEKAEETFLWLLKEVLGQQNLVLKGDFNYWDICCENNTAVVHNNTAWQERLQPWALILFLFHATVVVMGKIIPLTEVSAPLVWCLSSPVTALSPKCLSACWSEFSLSLVL